MEFHEKKVLGVYTCFCFATFMFGGWRMFFAEGKGFITHQTLVLN
jgi:hypothetical protein